MTQESVHVCVSIVDVIVAQPLLLYAMCVRKHERQAAPDKVFQAYCDRDHRLAFKTFYGVKNMLLKQTVV